MVLGTAKYTTTKIAKNIRNRLNCPEALTPGHAPPSKIKCAEHMVIKGSIQCHGYDEDVFHVFVIEQSRLLHGDWQHGGRHKRTVRDAGQVGRQHDPGQSGLMAAGKPKREKWPRIILLVPAAAKTSAPAHLFIRDAKDQTPSLPQSVQSRHSTRPPHASPKPAGRAETVLHIILLRPSWTPLATVEGGTNSGGTRSWNRSNGLGRVERSSPLGTPSGTVRVEPAQMKPFQ